MEACDGALFSGYGHAGATECRTGSARFDGPGVSFLIAGISSGWSAGFEGLVGG